MSNFQSVNFEEQEQDEMKEKLDKITISSNINLDTTTSNITTNTSNITTNTTNITAKTDKNINRCLEKISGVCDGRKLYPDYLKSSGTTFITLANITSAQDVGQAWVDITGSEITYQPPTLSAFGGATRGIVVYKFSFHMSKHDTVNQVHGDSQGLGTFKFLIDDANDGNYTALTRGIQVLGGTSYGKQVDMEIALTIDSTESKNVALGIFDTWTSAKKIKCQVFEYSTSTEFNLHQPMYYEDLFLELDGPLAVPVIQPHISIEAYGYA